MPWFLHLVLYRRVDVGDVDSEKDWGDRGALWEAVGNCPGVVVLAVHAHDNPEVTHETVGSVHKVFIDAHGPHLAKQATAGYAGESGCDVHEEGPSDPAPPQCLLCLSYGHPDRVHC